MTKEQKAIVEKQAILLTKNDVMEITGWGDNVTDRLFAHDTDFPAIKIGKSYQVELHSFLNYLSKRRTNKQEA